MSASVLPVFMCLGPALALIGFVLVMIGIASRQEKMWKWGVGILVVGALVLGGYLIMGLSNAR